MTFDDLAPGDLWICDYPRSSGYLIVELERGENNGTGRWANVQWMTLWGDATNTFFCTRPDEYAGLYDVGDRVIIVRDGVKILTPSPRQEEDMW